MLPKLATERDRLVRSLIELLAKEEGAIPDFKGVPGFWRGPNGRPRLGSDLCSSGTPLHHEGPVGFRGKTTKTVLVTEGVLKAATAQHFLPDRYVVASGGVATSHREIVKAARQKILEIAFDADCFTNPHVARAMASLIALRKREQQFLSCDKPTKILAWDRRFKGIDDALTVGTSLNIWKSLDWLGSLTPECFDEASHQLAGILP
ncbi:MAG: hypothetical protein IPP63_08120 [Chloracidobacterium sp.]|nr:hypothetical protein [Chloracidobacterium sp.]